MRLGEAVAVVVAAARRLGEVAVEVVEVHPEAAEGRRVAVAFPLEDPSRRNLKSLRR